MSTRTEPRSVRPLEADEEEAARSQQAELDEHDEEPVTDSVDDLLADPSAEHCGGCERAAEKQDVRGQEVTRAVRGDFGEVQGQRTRDFRADVGDPGQAETRKNGAVTGPTEPSNAEPNPDAAPTAANVGSAGGRGCRRNPRQTTIPIKKTPRTRLMRRQGRVGQRQTTDGRAGNDTEGEPTDQRPPQILSVEPDPRTVARQLGQGEHRDRSARRPNRAVNTGSSSTPPLNPATAESTASTNAAADTASTVRTELVIAPARSARHGLRRRTPS